MNAEHNVKMSWLNDGRGELFGDESPQYSHILEVKYAYQKDRRQGDRQLVP